MPNRMPVHRLIHQVLGSDVDTVIVEGRILMEEGTVLTTDMYEAPVFGEAEAKALVERAGLHAHMHDPGWGRLHRTFQRPIPLPAVPDC